MVQEEEEGGRKRERGKGRKVSFSTIEGQAWCSGFDQGDREVHQSFFFFFGGSLFVVVRSFFFSCFVLTLTWKRVLYRQV